MLKAISIIKSVEEHHLTHQMSFGTIPISFLEKDCSGTAAFRKYMAMRAVAI